MCNHKEGPAVGAPEGADATNTRVKSLRLIAVRRHRDVCEELAMLPAVEIPFARDLWHFRIDYRPFHSQVAEVRQN